MIERINGDGPDDPVTVIVDGGGGIHGPLCPHGEEDIAEASAAWVRLHPEEDERFNELVSDPLLAMFVRSVKTGADHCVAVGYDFADIVFLLRTYADLSDGACEALEIVRSRQSD